MADITKNHAEKVLGQLPGMPAPIKTEAEALQYLELKYKELQQMRVNCDVQIPDLKNNLTMRRVQTKAFYQYLMYQGAFLEACTLMLRVGLISPSTFDRLRQDGLNTVASTLVGSV